jgi:hypothetical protein
VTRSWLPPLLFGGNLTIVGGSTDALGLDVVPFLAPNVSSAVAVLFFSQLLTVDAAGTNFVLSNAFVNLFTQTP